MLDSSWWLASVILSLPELQHDFGFASGNGPLHFVSLSWGWLGLVLPVAKVWTGCVRGRSVQCASSLSLCPPSSSVVYSLLVDRFNDVQ